MTSLGVNPRVKMQGFDGNFYKSLKKLILENCGAQNLSRITLMSVHPGDNEWNFLGFDIANGQMLPISIARINKNVQVVKTKMPKGFDLLATVSPFGFSKSAAALYQNSLEAKPNTSDADFKAFAEDILHIENPRVSGTANVDCASCHLAGPGAQWARLNFPKWNWNEMASLSGWRSNRDLTNTTLDTLRPRRMRIFGGCSGIFTDSGLFGK